MQSFIRLAWLLGAALLTNVAFAEDADLFARVDTSGDGQIAAGEVQEAHQRLFQRLLRTSDKNEDGQLSREEFAAGTTAQPDMADGPQGGNRFGSGGGIGGGPERNFQPGQFLKRLDRDGDGKVSREEAPERMRQGFDRLDANGDGYIDADEFGRIARAFRDGRPQSPPPEAQVPQLAERIFHDRDANADGRITLDEVPEDRRIGFKRAIEQYDLDKDGGLTLEQFSKALRAMQNR